MNVADTRAALASVLNTVAGLNIRTRTVRNPKVGDGWIVINRMEVGMSNTAYDIQFTAVVVLGADEAKAESLMEDLMVPLMQAVTQDLVLRPDEISVEPVALPIGDVNPTPLYALTLTLNLEVD